MANECSICCTEVLASETYATVKCGHIFHRKCIWEWISRSNQTCPDCRNPIENVIQIFISPPHSENIYSAVEVCHLAKAYENKCAETEKMNAKLLKENQGLKEQIKQLKADLLQQVPCDEISLYISSKTDYVKGSRGYADKMEREEYVARVLVDLAEFGYHSVIAEECTRLCEYDSNFKHVLLKRLKDLHVARKMFKTSPNFAVMISFMAEIYLSVFINQKKGKKNNSKYLYEEFCEIINMKPLPINVFYQIVLILKKCRQKLKIDIGETPITNLITKFHNYQQEDVDIKFLKCVLPLN